MLASKQLIHSSWNLSHFFSRRPLGCFLLALNCSHYKRFKVYLSLPPFNFRQRSLFVTLSLAVTPFIFSFHREPLMSSEFPSFLLLPRPLPLTLVCLHAFVSGRLTSTSSVCPDTRRRRERISESSAFERTRPSLPFGCASLFQKRPQSVGQKEQK